MYILTTDPARRLITMKIIGLVSTDEVEQLYRDEYAAIVAMGCRVGEHLALVDLTECSLQLQDVVAAFQKHMTGRGKAHRVALFTGDSASRMQVRRIMRSDGAALFATRADAEAWLFGAAAAAA